MGGGGEGESTNERRWRERVVFVLSQPGMGRWGGEDDCGEAHHVSSLVPVGAYSRGERGEEKEGGEMRGQKTYNKIEDSFSTPCQIEFLLTLGPLRETEKGHLSAALLMTTLPSS